MSKIAIIIVNFNLKDVLLDCLQSVHSLAHDGFNLTTIVVDNASSDGSKEAIAQAYPDVEYIQNTDNLGFSGGNNVGMQWALANGFDYVVVLNPDVLVEEHLIEGLLSGFTQDTVGITVPKIYFAAGYEFHKDRYSEGKKGKVIWYAGGEMDWNNIIGHHRGVDEVDIGQFDEFGETHFASGCCFMIKREVLEKVGLFDERYFLYYEDADYCMRARKAGFTIQYVPTAKMWHKNAQSSGGSGSGLQDYFITRNRLLFGFTYASTRTKLALMRESIRSLFSGYRTRRLAVIDFYTRKFGKGRYLNK